MQKQGKESLHSLWSISFKNKVERLEVAFLASSAPFHDEIRQVEQESRDFQAKVDAGQDSWIQESDDGYQFDYADDLSERRDDALEALLTLRKAYTFLIYHQWERYAQHYAKPGSTPAHADLVKAIKNAGVSINERSLEMMRLLVNTLKHNSSKWGRELYKTRPDLFDADFDPDAINPLTGKPRTSPNWSDHVSLTDDNIESFLAIVRESSAR